MHFIFSFMRKKDNFLNLVYILQVNFFGWVAINLALFFFFLSLSLSFSILFYSYLFQWLAYIRSTIRACAIVLYPIHNAFCVKAVMANGYLNQLVTTLEIIQTDWTLFSHILLHAFVELTKQTNQLAFFLHIQTFWSAMWAIWEFSSDEWNEKP